MRVERELMRGAGPVAVMKLLERGEMYGYEMVEALARRTDGVLGMGQSTLYPLLYNLEAKGLIEGTWRDGGSADRAKGAVGAGRERKYYRLTARGKRQLARDVEQWKSLARAMQALGIVGGGEAQGVPA
jgi:PadR family transcriptional regulator PadR